MAPVSVPFKTAGVALAAGAVATTTVTLAGVKAAALAIVLSTTTASGGNTVQITINGLTPSGYVYPLVVGVAVAAVAVTVYQVGRGLTAAANLTALGVVPDCVQIVATVVGTVAYGIDFEAI